METALENPTAVPTGGDPVEPAAAPAGAPEPEPGAGVPGTEPEGQEQDPLAPLMSRMDEMAGQFGERLEGLEQALNPQAESTAEPTPLEALLNPQAGQEPEANRQPDYRDLFDENPEQFVNALREQARQDIRQELQPLVERIRDQDLAALEDEFPALATDDVAKPVLEAAAIAAQEFGRPELATDPGFIRMQYLAQRGEEAAKQETPAGGQQQVRLETGGGAPPEPQQNQFERLGSQPRDGAQSFWMGG